MQLPHSANAETLSMTAESRGMRRPEWLAVPDRDLPLELPAFFPSVSSVKSDVPVPDVLALHRTLKSPTYLVSAYDFTRCGPEERETMRRELDEARANGASVLLDSGRYEAHWFRDRTWDHEAYASALRELTVPLAFMLDDPREDGSAATLASKIRDRVLVDQAIREDALILPIAHGTSEQLPDLVGLVGEHLSPALIAVPERELGNGIVERAATVWRIRDALASSSPSSALHLLGTGNPISILVYAIAGADSFDGLEWCQTVVDPTSARLHHLQHFDFFSHLGAFGDASGPFRARAYAHNLAFMSRWMDRVRLDLASAGHPLLTDAIGADARQRLADRVPEVFA